MPSIRADQVTFRWNVGGPSPAFGSAQKTNANPIASANLADIVRTLESSGAFDQAA